MMRQSQPFTSAFAILSPQRPDVSAAEKKLRKMTTWRPGWSFGEGKAISIAAVRGAGGILALGAALDYCVDVFPDLDGGCSVGLYRADIKLEVSVDGDGALLALVGERGRGFDYQEMFERIDRPSRSVVEGVLEAYAAVIRPSWSSSAFWTSDNMTLRPVGSETGSSGTPRARREPSHPTTGAESQSSPSRVRVPMDPVTAFVYIAANTTATLPLSR